MNISDCIDRRKKLKATGLMIAIGSFGVIDGTEEYIVSHDNNRVVYEYSTDKVKLQTEITEKQNGVYIRKDHIINLTSESIVLYRLVNRFYFDGSEYDIYTQYNAWQHESKGAWQPLITQVRSASTGIRTCDGAAPIMAFCNRYTEKNTVFHIIPNAKWSMTAKKLPNSDKESIVLEAGFNDEGMHLTVEAGECINLPEIIFFDAERKTDLDAWKLHVVYNEMYPRKNLPVAYNSWLDFFDIIDYEELISRVDITAEMGFEAFMIDAGWFAKAGEDWFGTVGDWEEPTDGYLGGRLLAISEYVRQKGMVFGMWFEPERAGVNSRTVAEHPEFYVKSDSNYFIDFSNPEAVDYIFNIISKQIEKYHIGWLKFDFNATFDYDPKGDVFYRYMHGQKSFMLRVKAKYPDIYITNCASGGYRMELGQGAVSDSFWFTDNQGPYEGIRIVKDTLKRMPTSLIERWNVQTYCEGFNVCSTKGHTVGKMIHFNNATGDFLIGIDSSYSEAFVRGGLMGFSCNIGSFSDEYKNRWKSVISDYKKEREFFRTATARILVDSEQIIAIQYADVELNTCVIQIYTKTVYASELKIFPAVRVDARYLFNNIELSGNEILVQGILVSELKDNCCKTLNLKLL